MESVKKAFLGAMLFSAVLSFSAYSQEIYKWVDEEGNVNYTTRYDWIPEKYRSQVPEPPQKTVHKRPSGFATEEEVSQFFATYVDRYNQKDINGFLSLFSPEATQNGIQRYDDIKRLYTGFFDQSREIAYGMEGLGVEIHHNAVEAKASYELHQIPKKRGEKKTWKGDIRWILIRENGALRILALDYQHKKSS